MKLIMLFLAFWYLAISLYFLIGLLVFFCGENSRSDLWPHQVIPRLASCGICRHQVIYSSDWISHFFLVHTLSAIYWAEYIRMSDMVAFLPSCHFFDYLYRQLIWKEGFTPSLNLKIIRYLVQSRTSIIRNLLVYQWNKLTLNTLSVIYIIIRLIHYSHVHILVHVKTCATHICSHHINIWFWLWLDILPSSLW